MSDHPGMILRQDPYKNTEPPDIIRNVPRKLNWREHFSAFELFFSLPSDTLSCLKTGQKYKNQLTD